jgi:beta-glucosidase
LGLTACSKKEASPSAESAQTVGTVNPEIWPQPAPPAIDDSALQARLDELLSSLTVEEKVGQIIQADLCCVRPERRRPRTRAEMARSGRCLLRGLDGYERG